MSRVKILHHLKNPISRRSGLHTISTCALSRQGQRKDPVLFPGVAQYRQISISTCRLTDKPGDQGEDAVVVERINHLHIMTIALNRPEKRNCVNADTAKKLLSAFREFEADDNMYCAVFHGLGGNFCAGYDLEELANLDLKDNLANVVAEMIDHGPMGPTRMELTKPVIAAIEGWCVAGGLELALMADLRVADVDAKLGALNRRFGVPLVDGGSVRLPELIGLSRAMDVILTGRIIKAEEAYEMGMVNRLVKTGQAYGRAMHLAKELIAHPQKSLRADRASAYNATFSSRGVDEALRYESENGLSLLSSSEAVEGAKKFVEGLGKHGKFNVTPVAEQQDWQIEFEEMKKGVKKPE